MTDKQKLKMFSLIEIQICGMLIENGICEYLNAPKKKGLSKTHNNSSNMRILEPYATEFGYVEISNQTIEEIRSMYPKGSDRKGTTSTIKTKLTKWLQEYDSYTIEDVQYIMRAYVNDILHTGGYFFSLDNIFYKLEGGIQKSPFQALAEKYSDDSLREIDDQEDLELT